MPDEQAPAFQRIPYKPGRYRTEKLLGSNESLQGLPHEIPMRAKFKM